MSNSTQTLATDGRLRVKVDESTFKGVPIRFAIEKSACFSWRCIGKPSKAIQVGTIGVSNSGLNSGVHLNTRIVKP